MTRLIPVFVLLLVAIVGCDDTRPIGERTYFNKDGSVTRVEGQYNPSNGSVTYHTERYGSRGQFNQVKPEIDAAKNREAIGELLKSVFKAIAKSL